MVNPNPPPLRAVILYPGPQAAPFAKWTEALYRKNPMELFHFTPFVLIQKSVHPLSIEALRHLAKQLRFEGETLDSLSFKGPLVATELFPGYQNLCLANTQGNYLAILCPPEAVDTESDIMQLHGTVDEGICNIHQGSICNTLIHLVKANGIQGICIEKGREIWLPSSCKKHSKGDTSPCIQP